MTFDLGLAGRRALVTGGAKGVGASVVEALLSVGAEVITTARTVPDAARKGLHYVAADLMTAEGCGAVAREVLARWCGVDILVNVLGGSSAGRRRRRHSRLTARASRRR